MKSLITLVLTAFILSGLVVFLLACSPESNLTTVTEEQAVTVQRGDLAINITAVGNLAFSYREELTFGVAGTVSEVLVEVGDFVEGGQELAKLDATSIIWQQEAVAQQRVNLENAEENLEEVRNPYTELDIAQAEVSVVNAEVTLAAAQEALDEVETPSIESDIVQAELAVINAEIALDNAEQSLEAAEERHLSSPSYHPWAQDYEKKQKLLAIADFELIEIEEALIELMTDADSLEVKQKKKQLAVAQANLKEAESIQAEIKAWKYSYLSSWEEELKQLEVASAQATLDEAIGRLEMTTMTAPLAGIITSINIEAEETVNANQVVIEVADRDKFEADILVNEIDIFNIRLGAEAAILVDAMSGISLPSQVTFIAPTAIIQAGVVNYKVKVEILSPLALTDEWLEVRQEARQDISKGELPEKIKQAIEEGLINQQQVEEKIKLIQESEMPLQPEGGLGLMKMASDFQLREGLTVTVSIILEERNDVLLVPNSAITSSSGQTYVKMLSPDGIIQDRLVTIGISDWQYTEIIEGLDEEDKIIISETIKTSTTPAEQQNKPASRLFPGGLRK